MVNSEVISEFISLFPEAKSQEIMAGHTSWRIGGPAVLFYSAASIEAFLHAVAFAQEHHLPWAVMGGGTNLLVSDEGFDGLVIQSAMRKISITDDLIQVEAGALTALVARKALEAGFGGFEWAASIPGTIGGAIYGNAGCFGAEMKDIIHSVDAFRLSTGSRERLSNLDCQFGYRDSLFKHESFIILGCELSLQKGSDPVASQASLAHILGDRKERQPLGQSSAGSVFKNFEFSDERDLEILKRHAEIPAPFIVQK
ncbi:MAG TPA: FAD-binding protein, partial [Patescibacteria group bacterium]|nr:FAD-binding protein [Patescibacteria group bacterium]